MVNTTHRVGTYNPILCSWTVPPSDLEAKDEQMRLKAHGDIPTKRKVPMSPNVGIYNPVSNEWQVAPQNPRIIEGRTFWPRNTKA